MFHPFARRFLPAGSFCFDDKQAIAGKACPSGFCSKAVLNKPLQNEIVQYLTAIPAVNTEFLIPKVDFIEFTWQDAYISWRNIHIFYIDPATVILNPP